MILKNKIKMYVLGVISGAVMLFAGFGCIFGAVINKTCQDKKIYNEIEKTPAYTEYYNSKIDEHYQDLKDKKISPKEFGEKLEEVNVEGFIKQLPENEKWEIDEKLKMSRNPNLILALSGIGLGLSGIFTAIGSCVAWNNAYCEKEDL